MQKPGRNDPCPCGSGKKFKKCCELKVTHKKIHAQVLSPEQGVNKVSSLFQQKTSSAPKPAEEHPDLIL